MDYKKLHKDTITKLQEMVNSGKITVEVARGICEDFIPESEDERIRKDIISLVNKWWKEDGYVAPRFSSQHEMLDWLEKQGEQKSIDDLTPQEAMDIAVAKCFEEGKQKPADKVEPKFHEGEWVVSPNGVYWHIDKISNNRYEVTSNTGESSDWPLDTNIYHKFTIQDAKAGDVLICKGELIYSNGIKYERICLFNNLDNAFFTLTKTSNFVEEYDIDVNIDYPDNTVPATKEQKEIIFMAMKDAGYEFDFEKKELKKIEQKPAWSEEDEKLFKLSLENLTELKDRFGKEYGKVGDCIVWLKSLRPQPRWRPSDEHLHWLKWAINRMPDTEKANEAEAVLEELFEQLKKIREE